MPWCPKCGTEYRDGFDTCADCGEALIQIDPKTTVPNYVRKPLFDSLLKRSRMLSFLATFAFFCIFFAFSWIATVLLNHIFLRHYLPIENRATYDAFAVTASALAGFLVGMSLGGLTKTFNIFLSSAMTGVTILVWLMFLFHQYEFYVPDCNDIITIFLLPQLAATISGARGIAFANGWHLRHILWFAAFFTLLVAAPIVIYSLV